MYYPNFPVSPKMRYVGYPIVPLYTEENKHLFLDESFAYYKRSGDQVHLTAPLRVPFELDILAISNVPDLFKENVVPATTIIDPAMRIDSLILDVNGHTFKYYPESASKVAQVDLLGDSRLSRFAYTEEGFQVTPEALGRDQTDWAISEHLRVELQGKVALAKGITKINAVLVTPIGYSVPVEAKVIGVTFNMFLTNPDNIPV